MSIWLWILLGLLALVVGLWLWLAVLPIGLGITGKIGPNDEHSVDGRIVGHSPFARLVRLFRGKGANDPPSGITLLGRVHLWGPASDVLICHELGHLVRAAAIGKWRYLWRYITDADFRTTEEATCAAFGLAYHTDGFVTVLGQRIRAARG